MMISSKEGKIEKITLGNFKYEEGNIVVSDTYSLSEIKKFLENGYLEISKNSFRMNEDNPEDFFKLKEII